MATVMPVSHEISMVSYTFRNNMSLLNYELDELWKNEKKNQNWTSFHDGGQGINIT